jgi:hypothetical protein
MSSDLLSPSICHSLLTSGSLFWYQAGDAMSMLGMGGHVNCMTMVLFIRRQDILPGFL